MTTDVAEDDPQAGDQQQHQQQHQQQQQQQTAGHSDVIEGNGDDANEGDRFLDERVGAHHPSVQLAVAAESS